MTVICWDGKTLASDSRMTDDCGITQCRKIYRLTNGSLFGGAGDAGYCALVRDWLCSGANIKTRPDRSKYEHACFGGILISPNGDCSGIDPYLASIPISAKCYAIGSGAAHALALMSTGMTSGQAVAHIIAHQLADGVGGEVQTLDLLRRRKSKS